MRSEIKRKALQLATDVKEPVDPKDPVGPHSLTLEGQDAEVVETLRAAVARAQEDLGGLRDDYVRAEARALQAVAKARQELGAMVEMLAKRNGLDLAARWSFDARAKRFDRR